MVLLHICRQGKGQFCTDTIASDSKYLLVFKSHGDDVVIHLEKTVKRHLFLVEEMVDERLDAEKKSIRLYVDETDKANRTFTTSGIEASVGKVQAWVKNLDYATNTTVTSKVEILSGRITSTVNKVNANSTSITNIQQDINTITGITVLLSHIRKGFHSQALIGDEIAIPVRFCL